MSASFSPIMMRLPSTIGTPVTLLMYGTVRDERVDLDDIDRILMQDILSVDQAFRIHGQRQTDGIVHQTVLSGFSVSINAGYTRDGVAGMGRPHARCAP